MGIQLMVMKMGARLAAFFLGLACTVIFFRVWHFGLLIGDDHYNILNNPFFKPVNGASFLRIWREPYLKLYIPVTLTVWATLRKAALIFPGVPEASLFHALNVFLHWINGALVFLLVRNVLSVQAEPNTPSRRGDSIALLSAMLFVCHPLQATAVAWVTGLKDVLSATFGLLAIHALLRAEAQLVPRDGHDTFELRSPRWYWAASAAFAFAILSKPNMIVLPILIAILAGLSKKDWRGSLLATTPWLLVGLALTLLTAPYQADLDPAAVAPVWVRPFAALDAIVFYLEKTLLPYPLPHEYGGRIIEVRRHAAPFWLNACGAAAAILICWRLRRRMPYFLGGLLFVAIGLVPILGFVSYTHQQFSDVANRYMYFPMVGVSLCFAYFLRSIAKQWTLLAGIALVLVFGILSYDKVGAFENEETFYGEVLRYDSENLTAVTNLAAFLTRHDRFEEALPLLLAEYQRNPSEVVYLERASEILIGVGRGREAVEYFKDFRKRYDESPELQFELGHVLILAGDWKAGANELVRLEQLNPQMSRLPPPEFISDIFKQWYGRFGTLELLRKANSAAPHFDSLLALLKLAQAQDRGGNAPGRK